MNYSEKKKRQIAIYSLINGLQQATETYSVPLEALSLYTEKLFEIEGSLFDSVRHEIINLCHTKGLEKASEDWGISCSCLEKLVESYPTPENLKEFKDNSCMANSQSLKSWTTVAVQPTGPDEDPQPKKKRKTGEDKRRVTNYTIEQKIQAVKQFVRGSNQSETARELQIPAVNLMRWRDKIRKEAFQEAHVENLYGVQKRGQRNKMFRDLDSRVYQWYKENKNLPEIDQEIISRAKLLAKIDDAEPIVEDIWVQNFKKNFKIQ
jgi:transposase-like protein